MSGYSYNEIVDQEVFRSEAAAEIAKHRVEGGFEQFLKDVGDKESYTGLDVLDWLGY